MDQSPPNQSSAETMPSPASLSSSSSDYFNRVIGLIEDIVVGSGFQQLQHDFMEQHYQRFDAADDENRIEYMVIFADYTERMESFIVRELRAEMGGDDATADGFDMERFAAELMRFEEQVRQQGAANDGGGADGEIFELLHSLSDFVTFKELMLDYAAFKAGDFADIGASIVVQRLQSDDDGLGAMDVLVDDDALMD